MGPHLEDAANARTFESEFNDRNGFEKGEDRDDDEPRGPHNPRPRRWTSRHSAGFQPRKPVIPTMSASNPLFHERASPSRSLQYATRLLLAVALVAGLTVFGGTARVLRALEHLPLSALVLVVALYLLGQSVCAWKWSLLAGGLGFRLPFRFYWVTYLGAMFPAMFLPTSVGGDAYRLVALGDAQGDRVGAFASVLADRGTGVLALSWLTAVAVLWQVGLPALLAASAWIVAVVLTLGFVIPFHFRPRTGQRALIGRAVQCWNQPGRLCSAIAGALVFQVLLCLIHAMLGAALGLAIPLPFYFLLGPVSSLASLSPFTLHGTGERVAAQVFLFGLVQVGADQAVAFGLAYTAMSTLAAAAGGLVLFAGSHWSSPCGQSSAPSPSES